ncbi:MAG: hypothetical protein KDA45_17705, partial [Planctomycetales bacterium]|nr:hypothetical protein [Planctomycetales bacterium]
EGQPNGTSQQAHAHNHHSLELRHVAPAGLWDLCLPAYLPTCLPAYLPTWQPAYLAARLRCAVPA